MQKSCLNCKKIFITDSSRRKFCSMDCGYRAHTINKSKYCLGCGNKFIGRIKSKFCSLVCFYAYRKDSRKLEKVCKICNNKFLIKPYETYRGSGKFCSSNCFHKFYRKENRPNWKGGVYADERRIRDSSKEYSDWRRVILIRDDFICNECGEKNINLVVHHIKSYKDYPELRLNLENGVTLCKNCHIKKHRNKNEFVKI